MLRHIHEQKKREAQISTRALPLESPSNNVNWAWEGKLSSHVLGDLGWLVKTHLKMFGVHPYENIENIELIMH